MRVTGDGGLVCTTHDTARRAAAAGMPVWLYNFDYPIPIPGLDFLGATHGAEIAFVFGSVESDVQATLGETMRGYWTRLAAGDPNGDGARRWPMFSPDVDRRMNFDEESTVISDFRAVECAYWRSVYDAAFEE
jgi:para-nitrobenzyl esterase